MKALRVDKIDLTDWSLDATDGLREIALRAVAEVLELATKENVHVSFPVEWDFGDEPSDGRNGPPPADAMELRISIPIGGASCEEPEWSVSLRDVVRETIDHHRAGKRRTVSRDCRGMIRMRDGLRALADMIDGALE